MSVLTSGQVTIAAERWGLELQELAASRLALYGTLLLRWNQRLSLTSVRDPDDLVERHLMEGAFAAAHHPLIDTTAPAVLDFGSGTGVPGIPIAICRPELRVTLAESQRKKAAFLQEAVRQLELRTTVHAGRAETLPPGSFGAVWMRAVDRGTALLPAAAELASQAGFFCVLGGAEAPPLPGWRWKSLALPHSERRVLHIGTH